MLLRKTINPNGRLFLIYEVFRLTISITLTIIAIGHNTLFKDSYNELNIFYRTSDIVMAFDLYIRMHCQYYDNNGILVTHPWSTVKHYLSTSFIIDFLAFFPVLFFGFHKLLGAEATYYFRVILRLINRPLQMHRFFSFLTYYQTNITNQYSNVIQTIKYFVMVFFALGISSVILFNQVCVVQEPELLVKYKTP